MIRLSGGPDTSSVKVMDGEGQELDLHITRMDITIEAGVPTIKADIELVNVSLDLELNEGEIVITCTSCYSSTTLEELDSLECPECGFVLVENAE